jgi:hypothetical protein
LSAICLKLEKPWNWPSISISCEEADFTAFHKEAANRHTWYQPNGLKTSRQLPTILFIPAFLAPFLAGQQCTPWDLFSEVKRLTSSPDNPIGPNEAKLVWLWAMAAAQTADGSKSLLSMELEPVLMFDATFTKWTQARLMGTLGTPPSAQPPTNHDHRQGLPISMHWTASPCTPPKH